MLLGLVQWVQAAEKIDFEDYFVDSTLRIDYIFAGNSTKQFIAIDECSKMAHWYGKHKHLAELPLEGNGQITVKDHKTGIVIYRNSFSTLFQEWLTYPEAKKNTQSFQNVFLIPMPKKVVDVTLDLRDNHRKITSTLTQTISPRDILIREKGKVPLNYITLNEAKNEEKSIKIAFLSEGYTPDEMRTFIEDAKVATEALFSYEPFKSNRENFNVIAVEAPSFESGTSIPHDGVWKNTVLKSHFDTFYSDRYLTTLNIKDLHDCLAGTPYEHIIVLVNTSMYGGGGILNSYNLSMTHNKWYKQVVVHEFGHSFAGLADEYAYENEQIPMYPHNIEPWEPNITTKMNFKGKWENLMKKNKNVGFYEGAGYSLKGVWRGYKECRMRDNSYPEFCPICQQAIQKLIDFYTE